MAEDKAKEQLKKENKLLSKEDVSDDLKETKEFLELDRRELLNIIENSWDGIVVVDEAGIVRFANRSVQTICDTEHADIVGTPFAYPIDTDKVNRIQISYKNGKNVLVEIRVTKIEWMNQKMNRVVLHNITQQEEAKNNLLFAAEEWRQTFDAIGDGVSFLDREGCVIRCNKAASRIFNKPFPDVIGLNCHDFFHSIEKDGNCIIKNTVQLGHRTSRVLQKDERWYLLSADPMIKDSKVVGVVHIVSDITEQKRIEEKLREYAEYIESIVETGQAIIVALDKELRIKRINKFAEDLLGFEREDIIGSKWIDTFVPDRYKNEMQQVFFNCLEGDKVKGYEAPVKYHDGQENMISWYSADLLHSNGEIVGIVTIGYDISQRKEIEKVQRLAQLGTLVSHMAHEVNNPLMVISGRAQLSLMEEIQNQEVKDNLEVVIKECKRAKDIIQRLLRFSRPSKGELKKVDINKSLEEVISLVEHQFQLENVAILSELMPDMSFVQGDEKQLHEVFMNLLTNAQDAVKGEGSIHVAAKEENDNIKITFKDTGEGISEKVKEKIFDPFFTTKKKGTGLGLAICYSIIKAHNGQLSFDSAEGQGTTMVILLPVSREGDNA